MAYLVITGRYVYQPMHLYEMWFWLGAVLFSMTLLRLHRRGGPVPNLDAAEQPVAADDASRRR
mgnify:CR=1 FL=1